MSTLATRTFIFLVATLACFAVLPLHAQQPAAPTPSGAVATKASAPNSSDAAAREKIMATDEWKQVYTGYQKWLSTQPIYTSKQINRINEKLDAQIRNMPTSELQSFLNDWQAKLKVLNGKNFQEAQDWLGAYMTNMADGYRRNYLQAMGLTDIPNMSAKQLEAAMTEIRANQASISQDQSAFDQARQQTVQTVQQNNAATEQADQNMYDLDGGGDYGTYQSPYSGMMFNDNFIPPVGNYLPL